RLNASNKQGIAMVNGICGLVLLPDNWKLPNGSKFTSGYTYYDSDYEIPYFYKKVNTYTKLEWQVMEEAGAVFLPAAGFRDGLVVWFVGKTGYYWSRTQDSQSEYSEHLAYIEHFYFESYTYTRYFRSTGSSVRLCSEIK
ncbi:MAG: hypothetical protein IJ270_07150, partial [Paludibacteraceae bacterium]|nr:hypothetical protein [Paludibacteraceae bacterium]